MSLGARQIEQAGIPTVVVGSARDIVEECGVPRFVFVDFPLGNPCGRPYDIEMQHSIVGLALDTLEHAFAARTTVQAPFQWDDERPGIPDPGLAHSGIANVSHDPGWRDRYMHVGDDNREHLATVGRERRRLQNG